MLIQTWILHPLRIIGEAPRKLSPGLKSRTSQVPWAKIVGMRHILVHHYFDIDLLAVWNVVAGDLPDLKKKLIAILKELGEG
jgi:uncharacterized protein with HEPN domain